MKRYRNRVITTLGSLLIALGLWIPQAQAQDAPALYAAVDYMHAENVGEYLEIEKTWKTLHQSLVDEGKMFWWGLYEVASPAGDNHPYNYITVRLYDDFSRIENPFPDGIFQKVFSEYSADQLNEMMTRTGEARSMVNQEFYRRVSVVQGDAIPGNYLLVEAMDSPEGGAGNYVAIENEIWKPMHEQRLAKGYISSWALWARMFTGTNDEFDHVTVTNYDAFGDLVNPGYTDEVMAAAHPDVTTSEAMQEIMDKTNASRDLVRSSLWILLDQTELPAQ